VALEVVMLDDEAELLDYAIATDDRLEDWLVGVNVETVAPR